DAVREAVGQPDLAYDWPLDRVRELCDRLDVAWEPGWGTGKPVLELSAEHRIVAPPFVTDYPVEVSPLAHPHRDDPFVTERFELIILGREYANCFSELTDPDEQRARFEEQALAKAGGDEEAMVVDEAYLRALELGMPPNAGLGIGVDRLIMLLGNLSSIREALLFPQLRTEDVWEPVKTHRQPPMKRRRIREQDPVPRCCRSRRSAYLDVLHLPYGASEG